MIRFARCSGIVVVAWILVWGGAACGPRSIDAGFLPLSGPYLGQTPPGPKPQIFAPGIVSTGMYERDLAMTPDGQEIYFGVTSPSFSYSVIMVTKQVDGHWTAPEVAPFSGNPDHQDLEPFITPDGKRLLFLSTRPTNPEEETGNEDIWVVDRNGDGWGEPYNLGPPVNTENGEFFPSVTRDGTLYFSRTYREDQRNVVCRARWENGSFAEPEELPAEVNSGRAQYNAFIAPDESYIVLGVYGRDDSFGHTDYYVSFRNPDDTWIGPVNLGDQVNTAGGREYSPYVSPDGRYFFFMSSRMAETDGSPTPRWTYARLKEEHGLPGNGNADIYWMDASFIEELRP